MLEICASLIPTGLSEDTHWLILIGQSIAFIVAVAIILRLAIEKRTPSNIFAWSLSLLFMPLVAVPLYILLGGRKIRRLVAEKARIRRLSATPDEQSLLSDERGHAKTISGNSVSLLKDGVEAYRAFCKEIDRTQQSIDIITFILGDDAVGRSIVRRLTNKAREGVRVRLLIDALGSLNAKDRMFDDLVDAGGRVVRFIPLSFVMTKASANLRNHRKIAVFDGRRAIVGGQNMDKRFLYPTYSKTLFADLGLVIEGPAVGALTQVFEGDWAFASKAEISSIMPTATTTLPHYGKSDLEVIPSGPDVEGDPLWERIITLVQEAQSSITLITPYFIPDEVLLRTLIIKAHNGISVRIIVPEKSNHRIADEARNRYFRQMSSQGVEILFFKPRMMHAKLILVDGKFAVSGSANLDPRSFFVNFEIGLVHTSPCDMAIFENWLKTTILPHCITYQASRISKPTRTRLFVENLAHLLTPLL